MYSNIIIRDQFHVSPHDQNLLYFTLQAREAHFILYFSLSLFIFFSFSLPIDLKLIELAFKNQICITTSIEVRVVESLTKVVRVPHFDEFIVY